jgi:hypothetical protein
MSVHREALMSIDEISEPFAVEMVYLEREEVQGQKGIFSSTQRVTTRLGRLDIADLGHNLTEFCKRMGQAFSGVTTSIQDYELASFELALEVTAKGELRFIGAASSEFKGGLKLVFTRQSHNEVRR